MAQSTNRGNTGTKKRNTAAARRTGAGAGSSGRAGTRTGSARRSSAGTGAGKSASTGRTSTRKRSSASGSSRGTGTAKRASSSARRNEAIKRARLERERRERETRTAIALVVLLVLTVFLMLALAGFGGGVGQALSGILFGLFGIGAWMAPPYLFVLCVLMLTGAGGSRAPGRMAGWLLLILSWQTIAHLRLHAARRISLEAPLDLAGTFAKCSERQFGGGGIVGGASAWGLYHAFHMIGSGILLAGIILVAVLLLLQRSPLDLLRHFLPEEEEDGPGFSERRAIARQRRREERERVREAELEREAERLLRQDERQQNAERMRARRARRENETGTDIDLEHTLLGYGERNEAGRKKRAEEKNGRDPAHRNARTDVPTRDVHEITVFDEDEQDILTIPARHHRDGGPGEAGDLSHRQEEDLPEAAAEAARGTGSYGMNDFDGRTGFDDGDGTIITAGAAKTPAAGPAGAQGRTVRPLSEADPDQTAGRTQAPDRSSSAGEAAGPRTPGARTRLTSFSESEEASGNASEPERDGKGAGRTSGTGYAPGRGAAGPSSAASFSAAEPPVPTEEELEGILVHREEETRKGAGRPTAKTAVSKHTSTYAAPPFSLLEQGSGKRNPETERELRETAYCLQETLRTFGVQVKITDISQGPSVTRYELLPDSGVKVSRIVNLSDDIKLRLAATDIRIEAPIPGKSAIGIEVPNKHETTVHLRDLFESKDFRKSEGKLPFAVGKDIAGKTVIADIARMPHLLIAGATGSGKSVCINTIILSILYRTSPDKVRLLMIDPKVVELSVYKGIPHLIIPVVTDARKASAALNWAVAEMEKRYKLFAAAGVRDLNGYNHLAETWKGEDGEPERAPLYRLVIIVDELADLMMVSKNEVESAICRLAQLARAAGIHLIIATQRPSVDVITGLIKANMPSRIAFAVSSQVDSRTILDMGGAEKLIGRGDMLFYPQNYQKPRRIQGAFVSDDEVTDVVEYIRDHSTSDGHDREISKEIESIAENGLPAAGGPADTHTLAGRDEYFVEAGRFVIEKNKASIGLLQRVFKIGFNRAARIMDQLADAGVVSEESSTRARTVLMSLPEFEQYLENE